ncbi:hypothetical protein BS17DRAFT_767395 [Gyrodon lividus]|nr:hypothetical protein BS17DRAFT_767395 [Gyrodon lividus]
MATQLNKNIANSQCDVDFQYWCIQLALAKPILPEDCGKFTHMLMDRELMPSWAILFKEGQDEAWLPYHLFSISFHLQPAYDKGTKPSLNIHAIPPYDLVIETTKIFQKRYMPNSKVASNIALGNDLWWQEFHKRYKVQACMVVESQKAEVARKAAEKAEKQKAEVELANQAVAEKAQQQVSKGLGRITKKLKTKQRAKAKQPKVVAEEGQSSLKIVVKQPRQGEVAQEDDEEEESTPRALLHGIQEEGAAQGDEEVLFQLCCSRAEKLSSLQTTPTNMKQPTNRHAAQASALVDPDIQMASLPKMPDNNDNANNTNSSNNDSNDDGSDQANDSKELPSAICKGKAQATLPPQPDSSSMESEIAAMEDHMSQLSLQVQSQLADIHGWEVVTHEFFSNAEELEWEEWFAQMDQWLSQDLVVSFSAFEEQGQQTSQVIAKAKHKLVSLENPSATFKHYINQNATLGSLRSIPDLALGGLAVPYWQNKVQQNQYNMCNRMAETMALHISIGEDIGQEIKHMVDVLEVAKQNRDEFIHTKTNQLQVGWDAKDYLRHSSK